MSGKVSDCENGARRIEAIGCLSRQLMLKVDLVHVVCGG